MEAHPLFPPTDDDDPPEVEYILVTRLESGGRKVYAPTGFQPTELASIADLYDLFGGGRYELIARARGRISARRAYDVGGEPRPIDDPGGQRAAERSANQQSAPAASADPNVQLLGMFVQLMQSQQQQQAQFMQTLMSNQEQKSREFVAMMQSMLEARERGQGQIYETLLKATQKSDGGDVNSTIEAMKAGIDLARGQQPDDEQDIDMEGLAENVSKFVELFQRSRPGAAPPRPAPAPPPAPAPQDGENDKASNA